MPTPQSKPQPAKSDLDDKLCDALNLPDGNVLLRRVSGPDGINYYLGQVRLGRVYCVLAEQAAHIMTDTPSEFAIVFAPHRALIEAASNTSGAAFDKAAVKADAKDSHQAG
jgi:hypothetical protein